MATRSQLKELSKQSSDSATSQRVFRYFSEDFKRAKVSEIDQGLIKVSDICKEYHVRPWNVYKWIYKYSMTRKKQSRVVVELKSDTMKLKQLRQQLEEYERLIGQKQIKIDFLEKLLELAGTELGEDLKKKFGSRLFDGSGKDGKITPGA